MGSFKGVMRTVEGGFHTTNKKIEEMTKVRKVKVKRRILKNAVKEDEFKGELSKTNSLNGIDFNEKASAAATENRV